MLAVMIAGESNTLKEQPGSIHGPVGSGKGGRHPQGKKYQIMRTWIVGREKTSQEGMPSKLAKGEHGLGISRSKKDTGRIHAKDQKHPVGDSLGVVSREFVVWITALSMLLGEC